MSLAFYLFMLVSILQVGDWFTTSRALSNGSSKEANPVIRWLISKVGLHLTLALKGVFVIGLAYGLYSINSSIALGFLVIFYSWVCYNNYKVGSR